MDFLGELSTRLEYWEVKIETISPNPGDQTLTKGLPLMGITAEEHKGDTIVEIAVGQDPAHHQSHSIRNPESVSYLASDGDLAAVLDFEEADGTKTLVHLAKPMLPAVGSDETKEIAAKN